MVKKLPKPPIFAFKALVKSEDGFGWAANVSLAAFDCAAAAINSGSIINRQTSNTFVPMVHNPRNWEKWPHVNDFAKHACLTDLPSWKRQRKKWTKIS